VGLSSLLLALVEVIGEYQIGAKLGFCSAIRARVWMDEFTPWPEAVNFMAINNRCAVPTIRPPLILQYFLDKIRHVLVRRFRSRIARRKASRILFEAATRPLLVLNSFTASSLSSSPSPGFSFRVTQPSASSGEFL
jgi:hypothetical protein